MNTQEKNKAVVISFQKDLIELGKDEVFDKIVDADFVFHNSAHDFSEGKEAYRNFFQVTLKRALSDLTVNIYDVVAEGNKVAIHKSYHGILNNEMPDSENWRNTIEIVVMEIMRLKDGKIVECWAVMDSKDVAWLEIVEENNVY